ncbi:4438_t:CDS:2 [Funneliformis geosporum]|nr:4438_t:CDS:2 [Funneliformis geosporum]
MEIRLLLGEEKGIFASTIKNFYQQKTNPRNAEEGILQGKRSLDEYEEDQAFRMDFKDPVDFMQYLEEHIQDSFKKYKTHYNYIALVQRFPLESPKSGEFLKELKECHSVDEAEMQMIQKDKLYSFWNEIAQTRKSFKGTSALLDGKANIYKSNNLAYRGCRRALAYINSIFEIQELQGQQGFDICQFGQPLWIAYIVANKNVKGTISFTQSKLLGRMDPSVLVSNDNDMRKNHIKQRIVLLHFGCTAGLHLCLKMELPSQLARNHMATIVAINEDRIELLACYPFEPILSEVAIKILSVDNYRLKAIEILNSIIWKGCIMDAGDRGELEMRIVLLTVWMHTKPLDFYSRQINVLDFLQAFFPQSNINTCTMWEDFEIGFTYFIPIHINQI